MTNLRRLLIFAVLAIPATSADPPRPSPPLQIMRQGAAPLTVAQYRGKVVVLALIHTTCSHCQQFTVTLNTLAPEYTPKGVQFLECAFNDDAATAMPEFLDRFKPTFPVGYTSHTAAMAYLGRTLLDKRPLYVPYVLFMDRAGMIHAEFSGEKEFFLSAEANLRAQIDALLKPAAATSARSSRP